MSSWDPSVLPVAAPAQPLEGWRPSPACLASLGHQGGTGDVEPALWGEALGSDKAKHTPRWGFGSSGTLPSCTGGMSVASWAGDNKGKHPLHPTCPQQPQRVESLALLILNPL